MGTDIATPLGQVLVMAKIARRKPHVLEIGHQLWLEAFEQLGRIEARDPLTGEKIKIDQRYCLEDYEGPHFLLYGSVVVVPAPTAVEPADAGHNAPE